MALKNKLNNELLPSLFRQEYAKMTAVLCRHFGLKHIEIAEDIASDTFLKASEHWAINGVPEHPTAWLYTVAKNKTKDYFKHLSVIQKQVIKDGFNTRYTSIEEDFEYSDQQLSDSQLSMIFAVCDASITKENQVSLALQILCGFSIEEIANAFSEKKETIKKRLQRARTKLRNQQFKIQQIHPTEINLRLDTVLKTLYMLFSEGYFSKTNNKLIRKELCLEAVRLTHLLTENELCNTSKTNALLALMCYQSSRLEARIDAKGMSVLFEEQDKNCWDQELIHRGNFYLVNACNGEEISTYHLEASIAYWHTTPTAENKWQHILEFYNQLLELENSPITKLNRIFAYSKVYSPQKAIIEVQNSNLPENNYYHQLLGYLYAKVNNKKAVLHFKKALALSNSPNEKHTLANEIAKQAEKLF